MIAAHLKALRVLLPILRLLHQERTRLTKQMTALFHPHPDAAWLRSVPGALVGLDGR